MFGKLKEKLDEKKETNEESENLSSLMDTEEDDHDEILHKGFNEIPDEDREYEIEETDVSNEELETIETEVESEDEAEDDEEDEDNDSTENESTDDKDDDTSDNESDQEESNQDIY